MKRLLLCLLACVTAQATIIDPSRRITWQDNVGIPGGIPTNQTIWASDCTVSIPGTGLKLVGNNSTDNAAAFSYITANCPIGQVAKIGTNGGSVFKSSSDIDMGTRGIVIRGSGRGVTIFTNFSIKILGGASVDNTATVLNGSTKGSTNIIVSTTNGFAVGKFMTIEGGDDSAIVNVTGYETTANTPAQWQIVQITAVGSGNISFSPPLFWLVKTNSSIVPQAKIYHGTGNATNFVTYAGYEDLTVKQSSNTANSPDTSVDMGTVAFCWLKNVEVAFPRNHCVYWRRATRCEMFHCYIHDATINGSGGGYGVTMENGSSCNLVHNNIAKDMTGAFQVNEGSSGNVFAYNYIVSSDYYDSRYNQPDFQNHSAHPLMNLWEGNVGFMALFDDIHGSSSHHTIFRNRLFGWQNSAIGYQEFAIGIEAFTSYCNIVGNVLGESHMDTYMMTQGGSPAFDFTKKAIYAIGYDGIGRGNTLAQDSVYIHGNWDSVSNTVIWASTNADHTLPDSLYLPAKPSWWGDRLWPANQSSSPLTAVATNIPAGYFWVFGVDPPAANGIPNITSATNQTITNLVAMINYQITADQTVDVYGATGLPNGLTINTNTGVISGTPNIANSTVTTNVTMGVTNSFGGTSKILGLTVTALGTPIINSATSYSGTSGVLLTPYQITATQYPIGFGATGLPSGLSVDASTGLITGTPATNGVFTVTLYATNAVPLSDTETLTLTISATAPSLSVSPSSLSFTEMAETTTATLSFAVTNAGAPSTTLTVDIHTTSAPFSIIGATNFSLAGGSGTNLVIQYAPTVKGTNNSTAVFTSNGGGLTNALTGVAGPLATNLTMKMTNALLSGTMVANAGDYISQASSGGRAAYWFTATNSGIYTFTGIVNCIGTGDDSMYFFVDADPTDPIHEWSWNGPLSFASKIVTLNLDGPPYPITFAHPFTLMSGTHKIVLIGRENDAQLRSITIVAPTTPITVTNLQIQRVTMAGRISAQ